MPSLTNSVRLAALMPLTLAVANCGAIPGFPGGGDCPDSPEAAMRASFGLKGEAEGKVKAALAAGAALQGLAAEVEADVATACGNLAKDLGASDDEIEAEDDGPGKKAEAACQAAVKALGSLKAKASGSLQVKVVPPKCSASMNAMADCAAECDANIEPGSAKVKCEGGELSGKCSGKCSGSCTVEAGAACEGSCSATCEGSCEGKFSGECEGKCNGTCNGASTSGGSCDGTCDGTCEGSASGSCAGTCKGECSAQCEIKGKADCSGTCSGGCSVELEAPKCSGEVKPPKMSAECEASCDAQVSGKVECVPAQVRVTIAGAADAAAATKLKGALKANLPALLKVTLGLKGKLEAAVGNVKTALAGAKSVVSGGGEGALKAGACIAASLKAQADAAVSINVSVKASASASGEAGAG